MKFRNKARFLCSLLDMSKIIAVVSHTDFQVVSCGPYLLRFVGTIIEYFYNFITALQIPAWHEEANESLKMFNEIFPAFHYLGEVKHIHSHVPFDVDENIELVCQYLQAKKKETLDHWQYRKSTSK